MGTFELGETERIRLAERLYRDCLNVKCGEFRSLGAGTTLLVNFLLSLQANVVTRGKLVTTNIPNAKQALEHECSNVVM